MKQISAITSEELLMNRIGSTAVRAGRFLTALALATFFFWILPILVGKNIRGIAERLSGLPGVDPEGGLRAGVAILLYPLAIISVVAVALTLGMGGIGEGGDDPGVDVDTGAADQEPTVNTSQLESNGGNETEDSEETNETDGNEEEFSDNVDVMHIQVYDEVQTPWNLYDGATMILYDPDDNPIEEQAVTDAVTEETPHSVNFFTGLEPGQNYTVSVVDADGWPDVNVSFDPADYDQRLLNITVGYRINVPESHRAVYIDDRSELPILTILAGYAAYAENGDVVQKETQALHGSDRVDGRWLDIVYTDGETGVTYLNDGRNWSEAPGRQLTDPRPQKHRLVELSVALHSVDSGTERKYMGRQVLNSTGVQERFPDEPLIERVPQIEDAAEANEGRIVDVYHFEEYDSLATDMWLYVDVETRYLLRAEFGDKLTQSGDPKWITIDYYDHDNVTAIDEYDENILDG